jgi:hypothetical protein
MLKEDIKLQEVVTLFKRDIQYVGVYVNYLLTHKEISRLRFRSIV